MQIFSFLYHFLALLSKASEFMIRKANSLFYAVFYIRYNAQRNMIFKFHFVYFHHFWRAFT